MVTHKKYINFYIKNPKASHIVFGWAFCVVGFCLVFVVVLVFVWVFVFFTHH